ncbi:MAG TPA: LTA synthase family protein, partial [Bacillota bacterium]|nr:LTA synthase family protein [Bacillota bacterium]
MRKILSSKATFFIIAALLLWVKSYLVYISEFDLGIQNIQQEKLLFFNPISSILVFLGIALFIKGRKMGIWVITIQSLMTLFLYSNVMFYRFNSDFITIPVLTQTSNFGSLGGSIASLAQWSDLLYTVDIILLIVLYAWTRKDWTVSKTRFRKPLIVMTAGVLAFAINLHFAEKDRPQLLERTFDRNYIVKYIGAYNFAIYDIVQNIQSSTQRVLADSNDVTVVENYTKNKFAEPDEELFGVGEGKNIIKIHLESFQSFLIDYELHGEEVTPFMNSLVNNTEHEFTYYENFFHQTEQGKTADAELIVDNSLFGLPQGAAFVTKAKNTYQSLPAVLKNEQGYTNAILHGDGKTFWNRDEIYKQFAIDEFFDETYYDMSPENVIGYGLKDKPFFEESIPMLESLEEPFYAHLLSLTHHHPYLIDEEDATIDPAETGDGSVDRYFQTARYLDEALEQFFIDLKDSGLYEDSIIMIYGDHYGVSNNHNEAMSQLLDQEITPFTNAQLQRVPFMVRIPGVEGQGTVSNFAGQVDVMPTMLHLVGIKAQDYIQLGTDMFSEDHKQYVPFRNGDFITPEYSMIQDVFYDNETEEPIEPTKEMLDMQETVMYELELSDKVMQGDLLRYYSPHENWVPVDTDDYFYKGYDGESTFAEDYLQQQQLKEQDSSLQG